VPGISGSADQRFEGGDWWIFFGPPGWVPQRITRKMADDVMKKMDKTNQRML